mgnify:FL=1
MNLVDLYLEQTVFPLHKILSWSFEQYMHREREPIYTMGNPMPRYFVEGSSYPRREARIVFGNLTAKEINKLNLMMYREEKLRDIRLTSDNATLYLREGYIKSFVPLNYSPDRYEAIINCETVAISADLPITGFEREIAISNEPEEEERETRSWRDFLSGYLGIGRRDVM